MIFLFVIKTLGRYANTPPVLHQPFQYLQQLTSCYTYRVALFLNFLLIHSLFEQNLIISAKFIPYQCQLCHRNILKGNQAIFK